MISALSTSRATSRRCARVAACPASSRPTTWAPTSASSAAPARASRCWSPRSSSASSRDRIGLRTPRLVALDLDPEIARYEADEEVQDLLNASAGSTSVSTSCPGAFGFDADASTGSTTRPPRCCGSTAFTANVDRSWKNPNLLVWHGDLWVIDHGASLYFHHGWAGGVSDPARFARQPWDVTDHVLKDRVEDLPAADQRISWLARPGRLRRRARPGARRVARAGAGCVDALPSCGRRTSTSSPHVWPPDRGCRVHRRESPRLPVRRPALRAAARARGVHQRRRGRSTASRPTSSTWRGGATPTGWRPSTRGSTWTPSDPRWTSSRACAEVRSAGEPPRPSPWGSGSASSRRPGARCSSPDRSTVD